MRIVTEKFEPPLKVFNFSHKNEEGKKVKMSQLINRLVKFKAHKEALTSISFLLFPSKYILTTSLDSYMKVFTLNGICECSINVNHPLPMKWYLPEEKKERAKEKIVFALKVTDSMFKRNYETLYSDYMLLGLQKYIMSLIENPSSITNYFTLKQSGELIEHTHNHTVSSSDTTSKRSLSVHNSVTGHNSHRGASKKIPRLQIASQKASSSEKMSPKPPQIVTMKEEYSPRDLQFEKVKGMYEAELQGISLKQMEMAKKMIDAQNQWREEAQILEKQEQQQMSQVVTMSHHRNDKIPFFSEINEKKQYRPRNKYAYELMWKLEQLGSSSNKDGIFPSEDKVEEVIFKKGKRRMSRILSTNPEKSTTPSKILNKGESICLDKMRSDMENSEEIFGQQMSSKPIGRTPVNKSKVGGFSRSNFTSAERRRQDNSVNIGKKEIEISTEYIDSIGEPVLKNSLNFFDYAKEKLGINSLTGETSPKNAPKAPNLKEKIIQSSYNLPAMSKFKAAGKSIMGPSSYGSSFNDTSFNGIEDKSQEGFKQKDIRPSFQVSVDRKAEKKLFRMIIDDMNYSVKKSQNTMHSGALIDWSDVISKEGLDKKKEREASLLQMASKEDPGKDEYSDLMRRDEEKKYEIRDLMDSAVFKKQFTAEEQKKMIIFCRGNSKQKENLRKITSFSTRDAYPFDFGPNGILKSTKTEKTTN
jgi:hypothetical protein